MSPKSPWRVFRQMQDSILAVGMLVYAAAALEVWRVLPDGARLKLQLTVIFPGA